MNVDRPNGLRPFFHGTGGTPLRLSAYAIADQLASNIFSGDPVKTTGLGNSLTGRSNIDVCAAGDRAIGVFAGVRFVDANGDQQFRPRWVTGTVTTQDPRSPVEALVYDDPDMRFVIQVSSVTGLVAADVGQKSDYVVAAGNAFTGRSAYQLDQTLLGAAGTMKILALAPGINNDFGQFAKALVLIDEHENRSEVTAI